MATTYNKSLSGDLGGAVKLARLQQEITDDVTITTTCTSITLVGDAVDLLFQAALSGAEQTQLDIVIAAHSGSVDDAVIQFTTSGSLDTTTTVNANQTTNRTIELPDASTTLVGNDVAQTLTQKTIDAGNNTITINTDQVTEATNLFFTDTRVSTWVDTQKGSNNGLASLDSGGKVPSSQLASITTHSDVVVTSVADNEILGYDNATSKWINQTAGEAGLASSSHTHVIRQGHSWGISGEIKVASGDTDFICPFYISLASGQTCNIVKTRYSINSGTNCNLKLTKNDTNVTGYTSMTAVSTGDTTTSGGSVAVADDDKIALVVNSVSGTPINLSFTMFLEHTV